MSLNDVPRIAIAFGAPGLAADNFRAKDALSFGPEAVPVERSKEVLEPEISWSRIAESVKPRECFVIGLRTVLSTVPHPVAGSAEIAMGWPSVVSRRNAGARL